VEAEEKDDEEINDEDEECGAAAIPTERFELVRTSPDDEADEAMRPCAASIAEALELSMSS